MCTLSVLQSRVGQMIFFRKYNRISPSCCYIKQTRVLTDNRGSIIWTDHFAAFENPKTIPIRSSNFNILFGCLIAAFLHIIIYVFYNNYSYYSTIILLSNAWFLRLLAVYGERSVFVFNFISVMTTIIIIVCRVWRVIKQRVFVILDQK